MTFGLLFRMGMFHPRPSKDNVTHCRAVHICNEMNVMNISQNDERCARNSKLDLETVPIKIGVARSSFIHMMAHDGMCEIYYYDCGIAYRAM
jgi:hypothetical protein